MGVEIRRGSTRLAERAPGRATWHSFAFGSAWEPDNLGFGPLVCHDDHWLSAEQGFETHTHSDLVIVTWLVSGALTHTDPSGSRTLRPGEVGVLHAGAGVEHAEVAAAAQTRFVQVWLTPDAPGGEASYDVVAAPVGEGLREVVRATRGATLWAARLEAGEAVTLPDAARVHVFVTRGALARSSLAEPLADGDAFRITRDADTPPEGYVLTAAVPTELLVWALSDG